MFHCDQKLKLDPSDDTSWFEITYNGEIYCIVPVRSNVTEALEKTLDCLARLQGPCAG